MSYSTTPTPTPPTPTPVVTPTPPTPTPVVTPTPPTPTPVVTLVSPVTPPSVVTTLEGDVQIAVEDIEGLPTWAKVLIGVVVFGAVVGGWYLFHTGVL